jgi:signal transduction histidine kinase
VGLPADHNDRDLAVLTAELRNSTAAVIGYLELILEADRDTISDAQLRWVRVVERRLAALEELSREMRALCADLRDPRPSSPRDSTAAADPTGK